MHNERNFPLNMYDWLVIFHTVFQYLVHRLLGNGTLSFVVVMIMIIIIILKDWFSLNKNIRFSRTCPLSPAKPITNCIRLMISFKGGGITFSILFFFYIFNRGYNKFREDLHS